MLPRLIAENRFAVLDTEATGVFTNRDEVVQFAVIIVDLGRPGLRAWSYVQPRVRIHDEAIAVHGLDAQKLEHAPFFEEIAADFLRLLEGRTLVGYGIDRFDLKLLTRQFGEAGYAFNPATIDVMPWQRKFARLAPSDQASPEIKPKHNLRAAVERWVPETVFRAHDALEDCRATWNVFCAMAAETELGEFTLAEACTRKVADPGCSL